MTTGWGYSVFGEYDDLESHTHPILEHWASDMDEMPGEPYLKPASVDYLPMGELGFLDRRRFVIPRSSPCPKLNYEDQKSHFDE